MRTISNVSVVVNADEFNCVQDIVSRQAEIPMGTILDSAELETIARRLAFVVTDTSQWSLNDAKNVVRAYLTGNLRISTSS